MKNWDVYLLTESRYVAPTEIDWYVQQILDEDGAVQSAIEAKGLRVKRVDWSDPEIDWSDGRCAIFRTTWDYFERFAEFDTWFQRTKVILPFINPASTLSWNMDKHYLADLASKGIPIVPSEFIEIGEPRSLEEICASLRQEYGWEELILKPCVSGAARHTYRFQVEQASQHAEIFRVLIKEESMMIQPFQQSILDQGEISYMVMDGQFTHAIRKRGKQGDFRVQDDFGGQVQAHEAAEAEQRFAERVMAACPGDILYGRVDVMFDSIGGPLISEVELIEPELWFRFKPAAAQVLAEGVARQLSQD